MMMAASNIVREVDRAFMLLGGVSLVLLAGITIAMVAFAIRFRRGKRCTTVQTDGHLWLEIVWMVVPTVIVTWMFFLGYHGFLLIREVPEGAMVVEVTGKQWLWSFRYPKEGIDTTEMVVPVGGPVKVELTSPADDVVHSFFIPDFRVKEDAVPGQQTYLWFDADREGIYNIFCAEFCGKDHSAMITQLRVVARPEYDAWVTAARERKYEPLVFEGIVHADHAMFSEEGLNIDALALYKTFCASCHGDQGDGSGLPGVARDFTDTKGWKHGAKCTDIYRVVTDGIEGTQMRAFPNLAPWERVALAHLVRTFTVQPAPQDTLDDYAALVKEYELDKVHKPGPTISIERAMAAISDEAGALRAPRDRAGDSRP